MEGVELAARFGSITNNLKYCGPSDFQTKFAKYLGEKNEPNRQALEGAVSGFEAQYPYLKLIADSNHLRPFDYTVAEAFWLGNELLENVSRDRIAQTIMQGLTGLGKMHIERAEKLAKNLPERIVPHHSFHVYYIKFITGRVKWTPGNADKCRVPFGKIVELERTGDAATALYSPIVVENGKFVFGKKIDATIGLKVGKIRLPEDVSVGDWVAFHWDAAVWKLADRERANLEKNTKRNLDAINNGCIAAP
ncbi:MAG: DUF6390 family protein [Candidatus Micrarchaeota archaeon]